MQPARDARGIAAGWPGLPSCPLRRLGSHSLRSDVGAGRQDQPEVAGSRNRPDAIDGALGLTWRSTSSDCVSAPRQPLEHPPSIRPLLTTPPTCSSSPSTNSIVDRQVGPEKGHTYPTVFSDPDRGVVIDLAPGRDGTVLVCGRTRPVRKALPALPCIGAVLVQVISAQVTIGPAGSGVRAGRWHRNGDAAPRGPIGPGGQGTAGRSGG